MRRQTKHQSAAFLLLASLLIMGTLRQPIAQQSDGDSLLKYELNDAFVGTLNHTIEIENPTYTDARGTLAVPLIGNETARHYVIVNFSSMIGQPELVTDDSGNLYAVWRNIGLNGNTRATFEIDYLLLSFATRYKIAANVSVAYDTASELHRRHTQPEPLIQSDDSQITAKAQNLTGNANTTSAKVSRIYNFVVRHLHYVAQSEERGALWALENGAGDCSEYSYLFVALCRAAGIPARTKAGFAFHYSSETTEDGHMWAEYYLGDYGWVPVDATWRLHDTLDHRHFSSLQGPIDDMPYANYVFNSTSGIVVDEAQTVTLKPATTAVFGDDFFAENLTEAVQATGQAKLALFFGGILGSTWMFPAETEKTQRSVTECNLLLQQAVEQLDPGPISTCIKRAQDVTQRAWTTAVVTIVLYVGFAALAAVAVLAVMTRRRVSKAAKTI